MRDTDQSLQLVVANLHFLVPPVCGVCVCVEGGGGACSMYARCI